MPNTSDIPTINPNISILISTLVNSPINNLDPIAHAKEAVHKILDDLQETGILQPENHMSIEQLLNPMEEQWNYMVLEDISDEDICDAVLGANRGCSFSAENPMEAEEVTPCLTCHEALAAILGLQRYVQDIDTPYAWEFK